MPIDAGLVERLYRRAHADRWRVPLERFAAALERSAERGADLHALHLEDLALACGCAEGDEAAWEHFIVEHRPLLRRAADALEPGGGARDLADALYGELFERSLFRYFHGRSRLSTWLRAILAQRHVDRLRTQRRVESLPDVESGGAEDISPDPDHQRCGELIRDALAHAVAELPSRDRLRLACYYAQQLTLAETGTLLGEHEATCSRQLARTRKRLRAAMEHRLRSQHGLTDAAIAECVAAVSSDPGELDLDDLLGPPAKDGKKSRRDRSMVRENA